MKYTVKMRSPRTGKITAFDSGDMTASELNQSLELFQIGGFEIISTEESK